MKHVRVWNAFYYYLCNRSSGKISYLTGGNCCTVSSCSLWFHRLCRSGKWQLICTLHTEVDSLHGLYIVTFGVFVVYSHMCCCFFVTWLLILKLVCCSSFCYFYFLLITIWRMPVASEAQIAWLGELCKALCTWGIVVWRALELYL